MRQTIRAVPLTKALMSALVIAASVAAAPADDGVFVRFALEEPKDAEYFVRLGGYIHKSPWYLPKAVVPEAADKDATRRLPAGQFTPWFDLRKFAGDRMHGRLNRSGGVAEFPNVTAQFICDPEAQRRNVVIELATAADDAHVVRRWQESFTGSLTSFLVSPALARDAGDLETASVLLETVTDQRSAPRSLRARAWAMTAITRDLDGDQAGAVEAASQALHLDQNSPYAFVSLAGLAERRGDYDEALEHLRRAWGMSPSDVGLLVRIARVAERAGKTPDAVLAMERAVEINPASPELAVQLVSLQLRLGDFTSAAMTLSEALDRHPTDPSLLAQADRLRRDVGIR